jgi:hypothetical protein
MRSSIHRWLACLALLIPTPASALGILLDVEFDTGAAGSFATVDISEAAGDLDFEVTLDPSLGSQADLHILYFNLVGDPTLSLSATNAGSTEYTIEENPAVVGGAGSAFDYGVDFGNGAGPPGNGVLALATFTISASVPLHLDDLLESSFASGGSIEVHLALHVQGTDLIQGADSETVGGLVPEPATVILVATGLLAIAVGRSRRAQSMKAQSSSRLRRSSAAVSGT